MSDDETRRAVLRRWATRLAQALPIKFDQAREYMTRVDVAGPKAATDWLVVASSGRVTETDVLSALSSISEQVIRELGELASFEGEDDIGEEADFMAKKIFDMGENLAKVETPDILPPSHVNSRCVEDDFFDRGVRVPPRRMSREELDKIENDLGSTVSERLAREHPGLVRDLHADRMQVRTPEEVGGAGSPKVLMINPVTLDLLNMATTTPLNNTRGGITRLHGIDVQASLHIKEGEIFIVAPQGLTGSEADSIASLRDHISRLTNHGVPPPTPSVGPEFSVGGTGFKPGDVIDDLIGKDDDSGKVQEERRRLGDRRLRDDEK